MSFSLPVLLPLIFAPPPDGKDYQQTSSELAAAIENFAAEDRQASIRTLTELLELVGRYPDDAREDHTVSDTILRGWIVLAGLHLAEGDDAAAATAMDQAIRIARDQELPVATYGPKVHQLFTERQAALEAEGTATIAVDCAVDCTIVISQRRLVEPREVLLLGSYEVWIKANEGDASWERHSVELDEAGAVVAIVYADPSPPPIETPVVPAPSDHERERKRERMLPRAAEIVGLGLGVGLVVAGAVLLSFDGKCEKSNARPTSETTFEQCGDLYETSPAGISLVGVGGGLLVVSGVLLSVDEVRVGRAKGRQVMLGMSFAF